MTTNMVTVYETKYRKLGIFPFFAGDLSILTHSVNFEQIKDKERVVVPISWGKSNL